MVKRFLAGDADEEFVCFIWMRFLDMFFHVIFSRKRLGAVGTAHPMLVCSTPLDVPIIISAMLNGYSTLGASSSTHDVTYRVSDDEMIEFSDNRSLYSCDCRKKGGSPDLIG